MTDVLRPTPAAAHGKARVLFVANTYPYWTGTDEAALVLIRRLAARGHPVTVLETASSILEPHLAGVEGVTIVRLLNDGMFFSQRRIGWVRVFRDHPSDVCILNKGFYAMRRNWVDLAARLSSRRYVALEHHPADPPRPRSLRNVRSYYTKAQFALHYAALQEVVTNSAAVRDRLREWYGLSPRKAVVVPHGIDTEAFQFYAAGRERMRAKLGLPDGAFLFGSVGRLAPEKGLERLLPAFARVAADSGGTDVRLVLAGEGGEGERLRDEARRLGIVDRVLFPGWIDAADQVGFLSALDCFTLPSRLEGQGLALLQAMACERPSVASNSGGPAEIITDPAVGWLTPADDFQAFEQAMRAVLALSPERRAEVGRRARAHAEEHFEVHRQADRMIDALLGPFADSPTVGS